MPHQHHFLSRLDRIEAPQVELALDLYRDHKLLRFLLDQARIPEGASRVALSLDHPEQGPFLIITREGRFVTCLGEGMTVGDLPVITRKRLDGIADKHADLKARFAMRERVVGRLGSTEKLLGRLYHAGADLSREEFIALSAIQPLLRSEMVKLQVEAATGLGEMRERLLRHLRRSEKLKGPALELLEAYYRLSWASAHLLLLVGADWRDLLERMPIEDVQSMGTFFSASQFQHRVVAPAAWGLWVVGKLGKIVLPNYKRAFTGADDAHGMLESVLGMGALGLRHSRLSAEVRKTISALPVAFGRDASNPDLHRLMKELVVIMDVVFDRPEFAAQQQRRAGAALAVARTAALPPGSPFHFPRPEEVPEELAMTLAVGSTDQFATEFTSIAQLLFALPWISRAPAESFYAPADFLAAVRRPWSPKLALPLLQGFLALDRLQAAQPHRREPSKNGPCPCGSGKKHKRCCGEAVT